MLILSWNVKFRPPGDHIAKIEAKRPDIVTLQEVTVKSVNDWAKRLSDIGLGTHYSSGEEVWGVKKAVSIQSGGCGRSGGWS